MIRSGRDRPDFRDEGVFQVSDATPFEINTRSGLKLGSTVWRGSGTGIILAHGGGQTRHAWRRTGAKLGAHGYTVIAYDLRGHGDSEWATGGDYSLARFRDDLCDVVLAFDHPPVVVGASLGGISAMLAAGETATAFAAVVLVDVTPRIEPAGSDQIVGFMLRHMHRGFASLAEAAEAISEYMPNRPKPSNHAGLSRYLRDCADGQLRWHWDPQVLTEPNSIAAAPLDYTRLAEAARRLTMPVMLVRGGHSQVVSRKSVEEFLDLVPHARYENLADAHHMIVGDDNDAFTISLLDFLAATT